MPRGGGDPVTGENHDEKAPVAWPVVRLLLAWGGTCAGLGLAVNWYADGYSVAAVIAGGAVVGWLAGLYPEPAETGPPEA